jgi:hypothetical protein
MFCPYIKRLGTRLFCLLGLLSFAFISHAFSLLGPFAEWMTPEIGYQQFYQAGGPMALGEEYRWNLPVITYGFDSSFVEYFGEEGVAEVEKAITLLNELPPASALDISAYPLNANLRNNLATQGYVYDLKSTALSLVLQQLGLAPAASSTYVLRAREVVYLDSHYTTNSLVLQRNYDPTTLEVSSRLNGMNLIYDIYETVNGADAIERPSDPLSAYTTAVADYAPSAGYYFSNLSRDDVGGLRYLYSAQNQNVETLPDDVERADGSPLVNTALRPGVEKITFQRVPGVIYPAISIDVTVEFEDTYIENGETLSQQVKRHLQKPDITFSAGDLGTFYGSYPVFYRTSGTTNWINHSSLNSYSATGGPGVIRPGGQIHFSNAFPLSHINQMQNGVHQTSFEARWGSFTAAGEALTIYPKPAIGTTGTAALAVWQSETQKKLTWLSIVRPETNYRLQTSADLQDWQTVGSFPSTNQMLLHFEVEISSGELGKFYRVIEE